MFSGRDLLDLVSTCKVGEFGEQTEADAHTPSTGSGGRKTENHYKSVGTWLPSYHSISRVNVVLSDPKSTMCPITELRECSELST